MTQDERNAFPKNVNIIFPDQEAYKSCCTEVRLWSQRPFTIEWSLFQRGTSQSSRQSEDCSLKKTSFAKASRPACTFWTVRDQLLTGCSALRVENVLVIAWFLRETTFSTTALLLRSILIVRQTRYQQLLLQRMLERRASRKRPLPASEVEVHHSSDTDAQNTGANFQAEVVNPKTPELLA